MAMTQDNIRALDQLRQRLSQLSSSVISMRVELERNEPLPTWPTLQTSAQALAFNLQQLGDTFHHHQQLLKEAHAYPLPQFPGHTQEALLGQLLRKKLEPGAEDWIEDHTTKFGEKNGVQMNGAAGPTELRELWNWAAPSSASIVRPMLEEGGAFEDDFTIAEREAGVASVVTGLKRKVDGEDEDDDNDDDDDEDHEGDSMEDIMPRKPPDSEQAKEEGVDPTLAPMPIETTLRFSSTGAMAVKR